METSFTGVLVRRDYKPGQDYVQLIFKGAHDTKLSISRNVKLMKSLSIGGTYKLVGREYQHGSKTYLRDPRAFQVSAPARPHKKIFLIVASLALGLAIVGSSAVVYAHSHNSVVKSNTDAQKTTTEPSSAPTGTGSAPATDAAATVPTTPVTTTKPKVTTSRSTNPSTTPQAAPTTPADSPASTPGDNTPADSPPVDVPATTPQDPAQPPADTPPPADPALDPSTL